LSWRLSCALRRSLRCRRRSLGRNVVRGRLRRWLLNLLAGGFLRSWPRGNIKSRFIILEECEKFCRTSRHWHWPNLGFLLVLLLLLPCRSILYIVGHSWSRGGGRCLGNRCRCRWRVRCRSALLLGLNRSRRRSCSNLRHFFFRGYKIANCETTGWRMCSTTLLTFVGSAFMEDSAQDLPKHKPSQRVSGIPLPQASGPQRREKGERRKPSLRLKFKFVAWAARYLPGNGLEKNEKFALTLAHFHCPYGKQSTNIRCGCSCCAAKVHHPSHS
jgi:hypothetical protein